MKTYFCLPAILFVAACVASAQSEPDSDARDRIRYQLILPEEKTPEVVKPNEPNPFNKAETNVSNADETTSDENKVKEALMSLRATGIVMAEDGSVRAVMLGQLKLERGMIVPPVLADQDVHLRVNSLSESTIELFWIEKKKNVALPPRPVILPIDIKPSVRYVLPTAVAEEPTQEQKKGPFTGPVGRQASALLSQPVPAPTLEARRAIPLDENEGITDGGSGKGSEKKGEHPADLLMNLFLNKPIPTQQAAPDAK